MAFSPSRYQLSGSIRIAAARFLGSTSPVVPESFFQSRLAIRSAESETPAKPTPGLHPYLVDPLTVHKPPDFYVPGRIAHDPLAVPTGRSQSGLLLPRLRWGQSPLDPRGKEVKIQGASVRATRKPLRKYWNRASNGRRFADRRAPDRSLHEPPRQTRSTQSPLSQAEPSVGAPR